MMMTNDFTDTYNLYQASIFRYYLWKCHNREVAEDLTQETFLRFGLCLERKEHIRHIRGFLYRIAYNLFIDHVRRKKEASLDQLLEIGFEPAIDLWHHTYSHLDAERPLKMLSKMQSPYRQVLYRRFILGLGPGEIATITGETPNAVSVRICRGMRHLRFLLKDPPPGIRMAPLVA